MKRLYGLDYDAVPRIPKFPFRGDPQPATATVVSEANVAQEASAAPELRASSCETVDETPYVTYSHTIALKGIDILSSGRYRVQLNTFLKAPKKFSRNSTYLYEVSKMIEQDMHFIVISAVICANGWTQNDDIAPFANVACLLFPCRLCGYTRSPCSSLTLPRM